MEFDANIYRLLKNLKPNTSRMAYAAYDTAWIARMAEIDPGMSNQALDWLLANQLSDGTWGAETPHYHHDRAVCTIAAMIALAKRGSFPPRRRWRQAQAAFEMEINQLSEDPMGGTIGFEMIMPTLLEEAVALGVIQKQDNVFLKDLSHYRAAKLSKLRGHMISRFVTLSFSAEMAGPDGMHILDTDNLQEVNGSLGHSPSATAYFAMFVRPNDPAALNYLHSVVHNGACPTVAPADIFEIVWALWNLALAMPLDSKILALCKPHLDYLMKVWDPRTGITHASGYTPKDSDDTGFTYEALRRFNYDVGIEAVLHYEEEEYFRCFALEANPSISANIHVLGALRQAGFSVYHPSVQKTLNFLRRSQTLRLFWFDKWHASPYYATAHAIITCAKYCDDLVQDAVYWLLKTQNVDGSWGYYPTPTAEETAYCVQALCVWRQSGNTIPDDAIRRGAAWLQAHAEPPYPPLWIGKCLYGPELVVRSAILSALLLAAQNG